jgi:hypothetical protein
MKRHAIASVISFCSNDWRFFSKAIEGIRPFSQQMIVTVCDHFFDGTPENYPLLEEVYRAYPDVEFIEFAYDSKHSYNSYSTYFPDHPLWRHEWHNTGRWIAALLCDSAIEYLYFCDGDEVTEGERFLEWLDSFDYQSWDAMRFACHWYFREARYRADAQDDMCLLVKKSAISPDMWWSEHERMGIYLSIAGAKRQGVRGREGNPLVHHYSWVRTKEELLKKFSSWGHFWERDWEGLVEREFQGTFKGIDFIRGYSYMEEDPSFDPMAIEVPSLPKMGIEEHIAHVKLFDNVRRVDRQEMFRRELAHVFDLTEDWNDHQFLQQ